MSSAPTSKLEPTKSKEADPAQSSKPAKPVAALLEEDDEFEDFPVEGKRQWDPYKGGWVEHWKYKCSRYSVIDWTQEDATVPGGTTHLWEESWDDDDENDDFSKALR